jgi:cytochrome c-type protein NapB
MRGQSGESMNFDNFLRQENRAVFIGLMIILMGAMIFVIGESLSEETSPIERTDTKKLPTYSVLPGEAGVFAGSALALTYLESSAETTGTRKLAGFYKRRAYPGAPPVIPHEIDDPKSFGGKTCLQCHKNGGYVPKFNAFAPATPHPDFLSCKQCHVPIATTDLFKTSTWISADFPDINRQAMPLSPPPIPHPLHMRENCLACHGGPGAVKELRTPHPDRVNCRQCHAAIQTEEEFIRPVILRP